MTPQARQQHDRGENRRRAEDLAGRPPIPDTDYKPPTGAPPNAGPNEGTAGPFTVRTDGTITTNAGVLVMATGGTHFIDFFLRTTGTLNFNAPNLTGDGDLFLDYDAAYTKFDNLFGAAGVKIADPNWSLNVDTGVITGGVDFAVPGLVGVNPPADVLQIDSLRVLGLGNLAASTSRSGIRVQGAFPNGPAGFDTRFDSLFLADFGGTFHATFGEPGLDGLKAPFNSGRLTFAAEGGGAGVPLLLEVEGGLDLSSAGVPPLAFALVTTDVCPGVPAAFNCDQLLQVTAQQLMIGDTKVSFSSALARVLDTFTLEIFGGELMAEGGEGFGIGTGTEGTGLELTIPFADPITFPGFFLGTNRLRFDGTVPISIGPFNLEMTGLELAFGGGGVDGFFSLAELDFRYQVGSNAREFLLHMTELTVPFATFTLPPGAFPTATQVLVNLRETCDPMTYNCGCNPCVRTSSPCRWPATSSTATG